MRFAEPTNALTIWRPRSKPARHLAKKLKKMLLLSKMFAKGFKLLKTL
jgi:hypothetical protein